MGVDAGTGGLVMAGATCDGPDLVEVFGQETAKRALEVAAAGGHNLLLYGARGAGKTMLARCLPGLLPAMTDEEAAEVAEIYRRGELEVPEGRPVRSPHFNSRVADLLGDDEPGEVELAAHGVLLLDDLDAFNRRTLRALRQPLERMAGAGGGGGGHDPDPLPVLMLATMRSCPCGHGSHPDGLCLCTPSEKRDHWRAVDNVLLDLIPIRCEVPAVEVCELRSPPGETSARVAERVAGVWSRRADREESRVNGAGRGRNLDPACQLDEPGQELLETAFRRLGLTVRDVEAVKRVARTIADLAAKEEIRAPHVAESVQYRYLSEGDRRERNQH